MSEALADDRQESISKKYLELKELEDINQRVGTLASGVEEIAKYYLGENHTSDVLRREMTTNMARINKARRDVAFMQKDITVVKSVASLLLEAEDPSGAISPEDRELIEELAMPEWKRFRVRFKKAFQKKCGKHSASAEKNDAAASGSGAPFDACLTALENVNARLHKVLVDCVQASFLIAPPNVEILREEAKVLLRALNAPAPSEPIRRPTYGDFRP